LNKIQVDFPELISHQDIGLSYNGIPIRVFQVNYLNSTNKYKKSVMITGAHHSRELTSITMNLYLIMKLCYGFINKEQNIMMSLNETTYHFIPVVNVDGFKYISD
jgi:murein tripeptide amidase MpaA